MALELQRTAVLPAEGVEETADASLPATEPAKDVERWSVGTLSYNRRGLASLFGWLLFGDFTWQLRERAVMQMASLLLKGFGASDSIIGLMVGSVPAALGMLVGPVVNTMSDSHRGRLGRRIPFLLAPIPFAVAALTGLGFTPEIADTMRLALGRYAPGVQPSRVLVFIIGWTLFEIAAVVTNGIYNALVNDVVPHNLLGRFLGAFRMVSMGAGVVFNLVLLPHVEACYRAMFIGLALIYGIGMSLVCFRVKEGQYPPPPKMEAHAGSRKLAGALDFFRSTFSIPFYLLFYTTIVAVSLMQTAGGPFGIFFAKQAGVNLELFGKYQSVMFAISFCTAYLMGVLNDRFHPLRVMIVASAAFTLGSLVAGAFVHSPVTYGCIMLPTWFAGGGTWAALAPLIQVILPRSRFGAFSAALGILTGLASIVCVPAVGLLLDKTGNDYRLINYVSGGFGMLAVGMLLVFHARFMAMGGPKGYVAPE